MIKAVLIKAILFDLDGTFADTAPDLAAALNYVRGLYELPPLPLETIRPQASHGSIGLLRLGFGIEPNAPEFNNLREEFLAHYTAHICDCTTLFPGMAQLVGTLEQRGLPWGIVTNKPHRFTVPLMQALGYAERAACLISGDTCARAKPYPDPLLKARSWASPRKAVSIWVMTCATWKRRKRPECVASSPDMATLMCRLTWIAGTPMAM